MTPGLPDPIVPSDRSGPALRLLGVNEARGRIRGSAKDPAGVEAVNVALRRKLARGGCSWWLEGKRKMSANPRRCDRPRWINARLASTDGEVRWLVALGKRLPVGAYRVLVRAADTEGNESALPLKRDTLVRVRASRR